MVLGNKVKYFVGLAHHPLQQLGKQLPSKEEGLNSLRSSDTSKWRSDE